jgi:hypothetical protein
LSICTTACSQEVAARRDVDVDAAGHLADRGVDGRLLGHAHQQLVLQQARQQRVVDGVAAVGNAVDLDHRLLAHRVPGLGQVDERPLGRGAVGDAPLQHELGLGRHVEIVAQAPNHRRRRQGVGDGQLIHAGVGRHAGGQQHVQRQADADGHGQAAGLLRSALSVPRRSTMRAVRRVLSSRRQRWKLTLGPVSGSSTMAMAAVA